MIIHITEKRCLPCFPSSLACFGNFPSSEISVIATYQPRNILHYKEAANSVTLMGIYFSVSILTKMTLLIFPFVILIINT